MKVTSISAEQRKSAREAKDEGPPTPKSGAKKVSFARGLLDYAPRSKVYVTQQAYDIDDPGQGEKRVMKLWKETMEQAAKELGQVAACNKLERLARERGKLPEEERKNASFEVGPNKKLPQLGALLKEDHSNAGESWMYLFGNNKWEAVRLGLSQLKDLIDRSLASPLVITSGPA